MDDREFERELTRLMRLDFSAGTETFRDTLLARCLEILRATEGAEIPDEVLDLLAAAGDSSTISPAILDVHNPLGDNGSANLLT